MTAVKGPLFVLLARVALVWAVAAGIAAAQAPPDSSLRVEPGVRDRQLRFARSTLGNIAMLPAYAVRLPFQLLNYPIEKYVIHKEPGPVSVYARRGAQNLARQGFGARIGGLGSGSGTGGGISYRPPRWLTFGKPLKLEASVTHTLYEQYLVELDSLHIGSWPAMLRVVSNDRTQMDFYGLGPDSDPRDHSTYRLEELLGTLTFYPRIYGPWSARLWFGGSHSEVSGGRYDDLPSSQEIFDPMVVEGLAGSFDFLEYGFGLVVDSRDVPSYAHRGSYGFIGITGTEGISDTPNAYTKFVGEAQHFLPLPGYRRTLAMRGRFTFTENHSAGDHQIPVFRLEPIGSLRTVRGYQTSRFMEEEAVLASVEYRFPIWTIEPHAGQAIDGAAFFDVGAAVRDLRDVQQQDFRSGGGIGFRIVTARGSIGRMDIGFSPEGYRIHWSIRGAY